MLKQNKHSLFHLMVNLMLHSNDGSVHTLLSVNWTLNGLTEVNSMLLTMFTSYHVLHLCLFSAVTSNKEEGLV